MTQIPPRLPRRRRVGLILALAGLLVAGAGWVGWRAWRESDIASEIAFVRRDVAVGRTSAATVRLDRLPPDRQSDAEVLDLRATCAHAAGRYEDALALWARVPVSSPLWSAVTLARAQTLAGNLGRFAEAEGLLRSALPGAGPLRLDLAHVLNRLLFLEGRLEAQARLIRETRPEWRDLPSELRDLWQIDDATILVDEVRGELDAAAAKNPDDDRIRLGRAMLLIRAGQTDEAGRLLDQCAAARPDDPAVWLARVRLAQAAGRPADARAALAHLPVDTLSEAEQLDLGIWLADQAGDANGLRKALEQRVAIGPADPGAFERLAALEAEAGHRDRAEALRRDKAVLDVAKDRYRRLLADRPPSGGFAELATLAEQLRRPTEAAGWWELESRVRPTDATILATRDRLRSAPGPTYPTGAGTIADRLARLFGSGTTPRAVVDRAPGKAARPDPVLFADDAETAGLRFQFDAGRTPERQMPETTAGGVGVIDYDGDGWLDVYAIQGGPFPPDPSRPNTGDRLFRNRGDGTFEDVTERSGIAAMPRGYGHGIAVGDVDNDGDPDLFLTRYRGYALYRNRGDGTFEDATDAFGLVGDRGWPTSAALADLDNDGDLDLYVCHYVVWDERHPPLCPRLGANGKTDLTLGYGYCMPQGLVPEADHLFRNDGGRFVDVTAEAGVTEREGRGLGVVAADVDGDGRLDLFVANDTTANYLFRNLGGMRFRESGLLAGVACNSGGAFQAGMGVAAGDVDGDGRVDLAVTNFYGESTSLFRNLGSGNFVDATATVGLAAPSRYRLGFGIALFDGNNDGRLDLATCNGHVNDERPKIPYPMAAQLLLGSASGRLVDVTDAAGEPWSTPRIGRGLAVADLDNDGRRDVLLVGQDGPLAYLHNRSDPIGRAITLRLEGTDSNRDGVGARVKVRAGGKTQVSQRFGGGSFESASDPRLHFGVGSAAKVDEVEVTWPSGRVDRWRDLATGTGHRLREGEAAAADLPGFAGKP